MCELCKTKGMVGIKKNILDALLIAADLTIEDMETLGLLEKAQVESEPLTFEPNLNLGEKGASDEELEYRQGLLKLLEELFLDTFVVINGPDPTMEQIQQIDDLIETFITDGQDLVRENIPKAWDQSVRDGLKELKEIDNKKKIPVKDIETEKRDLIIQQQLYNIEDIGLQIRGRLRQTILINTIKASPQEEIKKSTLIKATPTSDWTECMRQLHKKEPKLTEDELREKCEWEAVFIPAEENLDKVGLWGWVTSTREGHLATVMVGAAVLGDLIADWENVGDDNVCEICLERTANGPYSILDPIWSDEPHFGCRCGQSNVRLASMET